MDNLMAFTERSKIDGKGLGFLLFLNFSNKYLLILMDIQLSGDTITNKTQFLSFSLHLRRELCLS